MKKKILIAVDDSIHSKQSLQYITKMFSGSNEVIFTLFHGQPMISQYLLDEFRTDPKADATLKKVTKKNEETSLSLLENQKERVIRRGVPNECIGVVTQQRMLGLAKDILEYARKGAYDAIVVGRRGLSRVQRTFMGSTSSNLLERSEVIPVWMVDGDVKSQRILVAVDGSESSYRAVDHVIYMFSENPEIKFSLYHVSQDAEVVDTASFGNDDLDLKGIVTEGSKRIIGKFFADAEQKFKDAGIAANRVETIWAKQKGKMGRMILEEADKGDYGTVIVGRRGVNRAYFFGSVSRYVTERITDRALWLVA